MADEADPSKVLAAKTSVLWRLIALLHVGLSGNLEVLNRVFTCCMPELLLYRRHFRMSAEERFGTCSCSDSGLEGAGYSNWP